MLLFTALVNETLEELLWRGVYVNLFPHSPFGRSYPHAGRLAADLNRAALSEPAAGCAE